MGRQWGRGTLPWVHKPTGDYLGQKAAKDKNNVAGHQVAALNLALVQCGKWGRAVRADNLSALTRLNREGVQLPLHVAVPFAKIAFLKLNRPLQ